jgi:hypothetical protein
MQGNNVGNEFRKAFFSIYANDIAAKKGWTFSSLAGKEGGPVNGFLSDISNDTCNTIANALVEISIWEKPAVLHEPGTGCKGFTLVGGSGQSVESGVELKLLNALLDKIAESAKVVYDKFKTKNKEGFPVPDKTEKGTLIPEWSDLIKLYAVVYQIPGDHCNQDSARKIAAMLGGKDTTGKYIQKFMEISSELKISHETEDNHHSMLRGNDHQQVLAPHAEDSHVAIVGEGTQPALIEAA